MSGYQNCKLEELQELIELASNLNTINTDIIHTFERLNNDLKQCSWFKGNELITKILSYIAMYLIDMAHTGGVTLASLRQFIDVRYGENVE